ncbi:MAG: glycosyltransferase family 39 protein [Alphaproteobacteria bacterium]|nr:glycosyltransferase family 39 protein [Alphaproteobacteria bacterium]
MTPDPQSPTRRPSARETWVAALVCILVTGAAFLLKQSPRPPFADEFAYLAHGYSLFAHGVFGYLVDPAIAPQSEMFFLPLYPAFLSLLMSLDQTFASSVQCILSNMNTDGPLHADPGCAPQYGLAIPVQVLLAGLTLFFVWGTARRLSGSAKVAALAAILALLTKSYIHYANQFLTEVLTLPLAAALGWAMIAAWQDRSLKAAALSGLLFGLVTLNRAGWSYAVLVIAPVFLWMGIRLWRERGPRAFLPAVMFLGVSAAVVAPWLARNAALFDKPALTSGYDDMILVQRLSYNRMTPDELAASFVYWLPDFGDALAAKLFPKESYARLDFGEPGGFYSGALETYKAEVDAKRGAQPRFAYLIEHELLGNLGKHVAVTFAMVWRGMFVGKVWGLVAWAMFLPLLVWAAVRGWGALVVLALPPVFLLGLNAFVSVSIPRYNLALIPVLSFSAAHVLSLGAAWARARWRGARA